MLHLWNTATRKLEEFKPIEEGKVGMYTCGPTVYWDAHIGNFRSYVFEDVLQRVLELEGFRVTRVMNITDVGHLTGDSDEGEDKMEVASKREGKTAWDIAKEYTKRFLVDAMLLNIRIPKEPNLCRATDHIEEQIDLIKTLEEKGFTYQITDGIYFDTSKFPAYGSFSGQKLEEKEEGARVAVNEEKKNKTDFALWKFSPSDSKRQMEWESPWGVGFPGWHVECSAMAKKYLGQPFDIHCGGIDHVPIHHENEIAQSEAAYGVKLANFWVHNEFLLVDGQKMSKSLGNVYTVKDIAAKQFDPLALRLFYLGANYRQKLNFTWEALQASQNALTKLQNAMREWDAPGEVDKDLLNEFDVALEDDLNTPVALATLWRLVNSDLPTSVKAATALEMDAALGLSFDRFIGQKIVVPGEISALAEEREEARKTKNWTESDRIRDVLFERGWIVEDTANGPKLQPR